MTLRDILAELARPGRDPREDLPAPVFKQGILKLEDLTPGMELTGTVLNVVDFGCFVDIGMHDSGLVHVSRMADRFIRDPHEVVAVGDIVKVWVMEVDKERRRVSLTMVRPGSERPRRPARGEGGSSTGQQAGQAGRPEQARIRPGPGQGRATWRSSAAQRPRPAGWTARGQQGSTNQQGGRPQGGRPQGGRPQAAPIKAAGRSMPAAPQQGGGPQGEGGARRQAPRGSSRRLWWSATAKTAAARSRSGPAPHEFKPKPKPLIPITDAMKKGKEPMRTFGDLMQFFGANDGRKKPPVRKEGAGREAATSSSGQGADAVRSAATATDLLRVGGDVVDTSLALPPPALRLSRRRWITRPWRAFAGTATPPADEGQ